MIIIIFSLWLKLKKKPRSRRLFGNRSKNDRTFDGRLKQVGTKFFYVNWNSVNERPEKGPSIEGGQSGPRHTNITKRQLEYYY